MRTQLFNSLRKLGLFVLGFFVITISILIINSTVFYLLGETDLRPVDEMYTEFPEPLRDQLRYYRRVADDFNYIEIYLDFLGFDMLGPYPPQSFDPDRVAEVEEFIRKLRADEVAHGSGAPLYLRIWNTFEHPLLSSDRNTRNTPNRALTPPDFANQILEHADALTLEFSPGSLPRNPKASAILNKLEQTPPPNATGNVICFSLFLLTIAAVFATLGATYLGSVGLCYVLASPLMILVLACGWAFPGLWQSNVILSLDLSLYSLYLPDSLLALSFKLDKISLVFVFLVAVIGVCAVLYSMVYLAGDANLTDFIIKLVWFVISMLGLVLAQNFLLVYFFWECIGITSMWLINFNSQRVDTFKSALKAFAYNKLSDLALFSALLAGYLHFGTATISDWTVVSLVSSQLTPTETTLPLVGLLIILAACIKSAQIGFHLWLPDSMDAPVPASALIHSATLVSAGVYLLLRFNDILLVCNLLPGVICIGALTAAYGGIVAAAQTDLKRALAYSTISHCGFLFVCAGMGNITVTLLYLLLHGLFKALSFMCAGEAIRVSAGYQDINRAGGLVFITPALAAQYLVALANLCGLPLFFGYSFKAGLQQLVTTNLPLGSVSSGLLLVGFLSSLFYFSRVFYFAFFSYKKSNFKIHRTVYSALEFTHKYPLKTPVLLFAIFWILYIASVLGVHSMFCLDVGFPDANNYSSLYVSLSDMSKELGGGLVFSTPKAKISYLFLFYNAFAAAIFLLLQPYASPSRGYFSLARLTALTLTMLLLFLLFA